MSKNDAFRKLTLAKRLSFSVLSRHKISILLILILGGVLRFYHLDGYGLWSDEFVTLMIVSKRSLTDLVRTCFQVPQPMPPFYFLLDKLLVDILGPSEISLRLLSAISSTITIYLVFALGKVLFDYEIATFAALLCAVNSTQIVYAQNARPYAVCLLLSGASMLSFLKWTRTDARLCKISYVLSTSLLLYSHYVFFPVLIIENLYLLWLWRSGKARRPSPRPVSWKSWFVLQLSVGLILAPLFPQILRIFRDRQALDWASVIAQYDPHYENFFFFLNPSHLFFSLGLTLMIVGLWLYLKGLLGKAGTDIAARETLRSLAPTRSLVFVILWYLVPLSLFFCLARMKVIHLFVERYLILASLATYLLLSAISLSSFRKKVGRTFLVVYMIYYVASEPGTYFWQKGLFSQGVPGGNEWRETLIELENPAFHASVFLFQSPFIESNQLNFASDAQLSEYLSSPLRSFYVKDLNRAFVLLPVHWWIKTEPHRKFKTEIKDLLLSSRGFVLLSTQEFWDNFKPWLEEELPPSYEVHQRENFNSSGALRLKKIELSPMIN
ncbi:MAG: hypothetical protein DMG05_12625 [Acidobacteria bacterium]|nr:MAG: hypothetical protein DMG05_12625 [Acidobacteriota bacterium]